MSPETGHGIVLFDGVCNLCNASVRFIVRHDAAGYFHFAPLQSGVGVRMLEEHGVPTGELSSVVLIEDGRAFTQSDAALRIARRLSRPWPLLWAGRVLPEFIRDRVYRWVAANRYGWFGRSDVCQLAPPGISERFLA
jgi:predicted DCC family thiol-disulfide oxidoreductase YuxK